MSKRSLTLSPGGPLPHNRGGRLGLVSSYEQNTVTPEGRTAEAHVRVCDAVQTVLVDGFSAEPNVVDVHVGTLVDSISLYVAQCRSGSIPETLRTMETVDAVCERLVMVVDEFGRADGERLVLVLLVAAQAQHDFGQSWLNPNSQQN